MKRRLLGLFFGILMAFSACSMGQTETSGTGESSQESVQTFQVVVPASLLRFTGSTGQELVDSAGESCTSAFVQGEDAVLELTEAQREDLLQENAEFIQECKDEFLQENAAYGCEINEEETQIVLHYDETIDQNRQAKTLLGLSSMCGFNQVLRAQSSQWSVHLEVINCHTGKVVAAGDLPQDSITFGNEEWQASYQ